jgi:predicted TIM-barrel fold metal-dependent hydrolase
VSLPRLLHERLDELGIDFVMLFPSRGLLMSYIPEEELRRGGCRALNHYYAELYGPYSDRIAPVAAIPMTTPQEAIEELEYAVETLGFKAVVMNHTERPIEGATERDPYRMWPDGYGLDSAYDYDPVWRRCQELGVAPTFHSIAMGWPDRRSPSSYMFNHIGHFAATAEFLAKSLFMGGVTRRFPNLNFGFLEGGVARAVNLLCDLVGHWEKRKLPELQRYNPTRIDRPLFDELIARYGDERFQKALTESTSVSHRAMDGDLEDRDTIDEWRHCAPESAEDIRDLFVPRFFFGCEADDRMNAIAFDRRLNPFGVALNAMFSSDIGHWDVPDIREVVVEAFESVEDGLLSEADFKDFTFGNVVRFYGGVAPDFFEGTSVAAAARAILDADPA